MVQAVFSRCSFSYGMKGRGREYEDRIEAWEAKSSQFVQLLADLSSTVYATRRQWSGTPSGAYTSNFPIHHDRTQERILIS